NPTWNKSFDVAAPVRRGGCCTFSAAEMETGEIHMAAVPSRAQFSLARRDSLFGYLFVAPQTIGFLLLVLGPLLAVFVFSTQDRNLLSGTVEQVGLQNYRFMLEDDPFFPTVVRNT